MSVWVECPYVNRDGQFNPDRVLVTDEAEFTSMSDAVMYNTMAWVITNTSSYSAAAAKYLAVWFINSDTMMNPNLNYAQMTRGPSGSSRFDCFYWLLICCIQMACSTHWPSRFKGHGTYYYSVMILRKGNSPDWTNDMDTQLTNWTTTYLNWMQTNPLGIGELAAAK